MIGTRRKALHVFLAASFLILLYTVTANVERLRATPDVGQHSKTWSQTPTGQKPHRVEPVGQQARDLPLSGNLLHTVAIRESCKHPSNST